MTAMRRLLRWLDWPGRFHDALLLDWIGSTRRPFEKGKTDEELFVEYLGRRPRQ